MTDLLLRFILPAAYSLLPEKMASERATAFLIGIALQESNIRHRQQFGNGPANGFWMFEPAGVRGVLTHRASADPIARVLGQLRYSSLSTVTEIHRAIRHNDILAACFARCLLWTDPRNLPYENEPEVAWAIYLDTWRPGQPRPKDWAKYYAEGWTATRSPLPGLRA